MSRILRALENRLLNMIGRGVLKDLDDSQGLQLLDLAGMPGEELRDVERVQNYGFTGVPRQGHSVMVFPQGDRNHAIVIALDDIEARLTGLEPGEAALYDDQGQKWHLTRDGVVGTGKNVSIQSDESLDASAGGTASLRAEDSVVIESGSEIERIVDQALAAASALQSLAESVTDLNVAGVTEALGSIGAALSGSGGGGGQTIVRGDSQVRIESDGTVVVDAGKYFTIKGGAGIIDAAALILNTKLLAVNGLLLINGEPYTEHVHTDVQSGNSDSGSVKVEA